MKGHWIAAILVLSLAACERKGEPRHSGGGGNGGGEAPPKEGEAKPKGGGDKEGAILVEKKPPVAEPVPNMPGMVISPYNGRQIDVKGYPPGTLVADPTYPLEEKKYFRVPEMPDGANDPARLLDPGILIRPNPPKENREAEKEKENEKPAEEGNP